MTTVLFTTGDVARLANVANCVASNWARRGQGPLPDFRTSGGSPLWASLDGWASWLIETDRDNQD